MGLFDIIFATAGM